MAADLLGGQVALGVLARELREFGECRFFGGGEKIDLKDAWVLGLDQNLRAKRR